MARALGPLAAAFSAAALAQHAWQSGMKAGDLGEQAEQIGVNTDQLQAYRFAAAQAGIESEQMDTALTKLAKSMGSAAEGNQEMIELFARLGAKLLDAQGALRPTADVLPELANGLLAVGSSSQRTADLMTLFGRSGAKMTTVLKEIAGGNDALVASARKQGGVLQTEVIEAWDRVSDSMKRASLASEVTYAKIGAPIVTTGLDTVETVMKSISKRFEELGRSIALIGTHRGVLEQIMEVVNVLSFGIGSGVRGKDAITRATEGIDRARAAAVEAEVELQRLLSMSQQTGMSYRYDGAINAQRQKVAAANAQVSAAEQALADYQEGQQIGVGKMPPITVVGDRNPVPKGQTDAWDKMVAGAKAYVAQKEVETKAVGMSAEAAARMAYEQEMVNKATEAGLTLGASQLQQIKDLAAAKASADMGLRSAKFVDDTTTGAADYVAGQAVDQQALWLGAEAAARLRFETEMLNKAKKEGLDQDPAVIASIRESAASMAAAQAQTQQLTEIYNFSRETFRGLFTDFLQGLQQGQSLWDAFGNAAMNALNRIASKLIEMAAEKLFEAAFSGGKGGGGGGGIGGLIGNLIGSALNGIFGGGGGVPGADMLSGTGGLYANGAAFHRGNVIPFARGGIVNRPTLFPMANGAGLMGEAGPEGILPLRRGRGGRLGVEASGMGGGGDVYVTINNTSKAQVETRKSRAPGGQKQLEIMIADAVEGRIASRMDRGEGPITKVMAGRYGVTAR